MVWRIKIRTRHLPLPFLLPLGCLLSHTPRGTKKVHVHKIVKLLSMFSLHIHSSCIYMIRLYITVFLYATVKSLFDEKAMQTRVRMYIHLLVLYVIEQQTRSPHIQCYILAVRVCVYCYFLHYSLHLFQRRAKSPPKFLLSSLEQRVYSQSIGSCVCM